LRQPARPLAAEPALPQAAAVALAAGRHIAVHAVSEAGVIDLEAQAGTQAGTQTEGRHQESVLAADGVFALLEKHQRKTCVHSVAVLVLCLALIAAARHRQHKHLYLT